MGRARLSEQLEIRPSIKPDAHGAATINGTGIDCKGFRSVTFIIDYGTKGTSLDCLIQESEDDGVDDAYSNVSGAVITQLVAGAEIAIINVNCEQTERFLRPQAIAGGTEDFSVIAVLGNAEATPQDNAHLDEIINTH